MSNAERPVSPGSPASIAPWVAMWVWRIRRFVSPVVLGVGLVWALAVSPAHADGLGGLSVVLSSLEPDRANTPPSSSALP